MSEDGLKTKSGFVSLIGRPNVGKSTLMNRLIGQKIAITSSKPQTTRNKIQTVYTDERGQIVFLDTPGIHKAKTKLGDFMVESAEKTFGDSDVIMWLIEPSTYIGAGDREVAKLLSQSNKPKILVINKVDTIKKEEVLGIIDAYKSVANFAEIIPVSAMDGTGCDELLATLYSYLKEGPMYYDEETVTDQTMREIAGELIREQALRKLRDEIPHGIAVNILQMHYREKGMSGIWDIEAEIICERESHKGIIIGRGGEMLKRIGTGARIEIEKMTGEKVGLKLFVKVRKDWRDNETFLKEFGYK